MSDKSNTDSEYKGASVFEPNIKASEDTDYIQKIMCDEQFTNYYPEDVKWLLKNSVACPYGQGCNCFKSEYYEFDRMCYSCLYPSILLPEVNDLNNIVNGSNLTESQLKKDDFDPIEYYNRSIEQNEQ